MTNSMLNRSPAPRGLGRLLDQFFTGDVVEPAAGARAWFASASLWEDADNFHVEIDLPGVQRDDVDLVLEKGVLRIKAERKAPEGERKYWHQERGFGTVERVISLPETVDADRIDANLNEGVLTISLGKRAEHQPRKISVRG